MSQHLTSQQILECLIGAGDLDGQRHARECSRMPSRNGERG